MEASSVIDLKANGSVPKLEHFACVDERVDIAPFLKELSRNEKAFSLDPGRQKALPVHRETEAVVLRKRPFSVYPGVISSEDIQETFEDTSLTALFPNIYGFTKKFAEQKNGELGIVTIARLKPGKPVYPHRDAGKYYDIRDRYHLVLQSPAGSLLKSGDETVRMHEAELWWFDNHAVHESFNEGNDWRTHLIFDVLPRAKRIKMAWIIMRQRLRLLLASDKRVSPTPTYTG